MVYSQELVKIDAGQSIEWVPTDKGHNVEMLAGPSGYDLPKKTKLNKPVNMTFTKPGIYLLSMLSPCSFRNDWFNSCWRRYV